MIDKWLLENATFLGLDRVLEFDSFIATDPQYATRLKCPVCGEFYNHAGPFQYIDGRDNHEAGWGGRGDLVIIPVRCEFEHIWQLCLGQHKGTTYVFVRVPEQWKEAA